ncbi:MAG: MauE/DoxX family redox-associated membrane protein [Ginsengibacter sp.]
MTALTIIASFILACVFIVAGFLKIANRDNTSQTLINFGVPKYFAGYLKTLLPIIELITGLLLLTPFAACGAIASLLLLIVFTSIVGINLAKGVRPPCRCFGQLDSRPISWRTLIRNFFLIMLAGFLLWQKNTEDANLVTWFLSLSLLPRIGVIICIIFLLQSAAIAWLLRQLWRQQGRLLLAIEGLQSSGPGERKQILSGLPVHSKAPGFELDSVEGGVETLTSLLEWGKDILLFFTDPDCGPCHELFPFIKKWQSNYESEFLFIIISRGDLMKTKQLAEKNELVNVLVQNDWEVALTYQVPGTPCFVFISKDGLIGDQLAFDVNGIKVMVDKIINGNHPVNYTNQYLKASAASVYYD